MYKVEYLVLLNKEHIRCKTVKALKNLLASDSEIEISNNQVTYNSYTTEIDIQVGKEAGKDHSFFDITLKCTNEDDIDKFSSLLKAVRRSLSILDKNHYIIWDELSLYYAQQAYPIIFEIENLMRLLISKFMLTNLGILWTKDRVPNDVQQTINSSNKDINYLNNVDFIQLKNILFSENFPQHKEGLIKELREAKEITELKIDQIKALLPESNWRRYFQPLVECEAQYLETRWEKLYELRCNVAHNKSFSKTDLESVVKITSELKPYLEKAVANLHHIVIAEDEKENLAESAAININEIYGRFLLKYREFESLTHDAANRLEKREGKHIHYPIKELTEILAKHGFFNEDDIRTVFQIYQFRNSIVHLHNFKIDAAHFASYEAKLDDLIYTFKFFF